MRHNLSEVLTSPCVQVHTDQVGPQLVDRETNTSVVDIRLIAEEVRTDLLYTHSIGIQMPSTSSGLSSSTMNKREFITEPHIPIRIPQLDGPSFGMCEKEATYANDKNSDCGFWRRLS